MTQAPLEDRIQNILKEVHFDRHKEYVVKCIQNGLDRKQAALETGLSKYSPYADNKANKAIDRIVKTVADELGITAIEVINGLRAEATGTARDEQTGAPLDTNSSARVSAWKLLGQTLSMFTENHQLNSNIRVEFVTDWRGEKLPICDETPALDIPDAEIVDG